MQELRDQKRREFEAVAIFPCKLRIIPDYVFNTRDPIVVGVVVEAGLVKRGTVLTVPSKSVSDCECVHKCEWCVWGVYGCGVWVWWPYCCKIVSVFEIISDTKLITTMLAY